MLFVILSVNVKYINVKSKHTVRFRTYWAQQSSFYLGCIPTLSFINLQMYKARVYWFVLKNEIHFILFFCIYQSINQYLLQIANITQMFFWAFSSCFDPIFTIQCTHFTCFIYIIYNISQITLLKILKVYSAWKMFTASATLPGKF